jgi:predicted enzyme related to lactoylglutathione lyase
MTEAKVAYIVIDSVDPEPLARFWCALLGEEVTARVDDGRYTVLSSSGEGVPALSFQRVDEAKAGKNRMHLDLEVEDLDAATARIEELGGRWTEPGTTREIDGFTWRCMADPEGNEFDVVIG